VSIDTGFFVPGSRIPRSRGGDSAYALMSLIRLPFGHARLI
jgi:hypothetical protein